MLVSKQLPHQHRLSSLLAWAVPLPHFSTHAQGEVEGLHAALLQEKRAVVALRDELGLMATSRDTWRVSASWRSCWHRWGHEEMQRCVGWCLCTPASSL